MTYSPITSRPYPGLLATADQWTHATNSVGNQLDEAYQATWQPCLVSAALDIQSSLTSHSSDHANFRMRGNADKQQVRAHVRMRIVDNGGGITTGTVRIRIDGTDDITVATTNTSFEIQSGSVTVTTGSDPRGVAVSAIHDGSGTDRCDVDSVTCYVEPASAPSSGVLSSGFTRWDAANAALGTTGYPIASEWVSRLIRGPYQIARDRPVCLWSHMTKTGGKGAFLNSTTNYQLVSEGILPGDQLHGAAGRDYRADIYLGASGTPTAKIILGGQSWESSAALGWQTHEFAGVTEYPVRMQVYIKASAAASASLEALQIWREPA